MNKYKHCPLDRSKNSRTLPSGGQLLKKNMDLCCPLVPNKCESSLKLIKILCKCMQIILINPYKKGLNWPQGTKQVILMNKQIFSV